MRKFLIVWLFCISVLLVSGKEYQRFDEDDCYYLTTKFIIEKNSVQLIVKAVGKNQNFKGFTKILTGELKEDKIYYTKIKFNDRPERTIPADISTFKQGNGKIIVDNDELIEVIKK